MPRFAANISLLFREMPLPQRVFAAADAGFEAVEILFPYDEPVRDLRLALTRTGLPLALINSPPPNYTGGPRGFAAVPGSEERFRSDFQRALRYVDSLKAERIHIMSGQTDDPAALDTLIANLRWAVAEAPQQALTIEPINRDDIPGYFLSDFDLAAEILDTVGAPNLGLQFDAYHAHKITGDLPGTWARHGARAVHVQIAGVPGRHEPVKGDIDYPAFFAQLDAEGYAGYVSAEYGPAADTASGLGWLAEAQAAMPLPPSSTGRSSSRASSGRG
ncbi:hydroxypyruvate isomerase family protein [Pseudooceanicola nanhaiensis]|uniref:hydroxypyruvate isomerase family protein n=1 Tax=Pseudooceanicola nanhaiensis TaxID=375761 RepID=UPI001CD3C1BB|nr:TIM barrel protein [Pseudooceanicola nanhaiensis]MCA0921359.1 TIM barrel protein [Pseudooceanicola nanhaiensis]